MRKEPSEKERMNILLEEVRSQFNIVTETVLQVRDDVKELKQDQKKTNSEIELLKVATTVTNKKTRFNFRRCLRNQK